MCQACGEEVLSLKRVRIMNIQLGDVKYNCYREVTGEELQELYEQAGMKKSKEGFYGSKEAL